MYFCCSAVTDWQEPPGHYAVDWNPGRNVLWPQYEMTSTANWPSAQGLSLLFWPSALCRTGPTIKLYKQTRSACLLHWVSRAGPWAKLELQGAFLTDFFSHPSLLGWPTRDQVITERPNVPQQDLIRYQVLVIGIWVNTTTVDSYTYDKDLISDQIRSCWGTDQILKS